MPSPAAARRLRFSLERDRYAPRRARRAVTGLVAAETGDAVAERVRLLVSELVTNAVRHGDGQEVGIEVAIEPPAVRIEVVDAGEGRPRLREPGEDGGFGLHLVGRLADRWGVREGSTHVWFEIDRGA